MPRPSIAEIADSLIKRDRKIWISIGWRGMTGRFPGVHHLAGKSDSYVGEAVMNKVENAVVEHTVYFLDKAQATSRDLSNGLTAEQRTRLSIESLMNARHMLCTLYQAGFEGLRGDIEALDEGIDAIARFLLKSLVTDLLAGRIRRDEAVAITRDLKEIIIAGKWPNVGEDLDELFGPEPEVLEPEMLDASPDASDLIGFGSLAHAAAD